MLTLRELQRRAEAKRDASIRRARVRYHQERDRIHARFLRIREEARRKRDLAKRQRRAGKPKTAFIIAIETMPRNRPFAIQELVAMMHVAHPHRHFHRPVVNTYVHKLARQGAVKRLRRHGKRVLYAVAGYVEAETPYAMRTYHDVAREVLREHGPMQIWHLFAILCERGYRADIVPEKLLHTLRVAMQKRPAMFRQDRAGRWHAR